MLGFSFQRIVVIGVTGSGKTTLAANIAHQLGVPHIELDALHWEPNWKHVSNDEFRSRVAEASSAPAWVADGNYSVCRDILWNRAQALIWLDYPLWTVFWRLWRRTWQRWWRRDLLWGINREPLLAHFKFWSDESLFRWLFKTYWRRKRQYPVLFTSPEYTRLKVIHLHSPEQAQAWLAGIWPGYYTGTH